MRILFLLLVLLFHLFLLSRLTFTAWPEMFSYPYLFSNGFSLYKDFIMPYPPGLILILSSVFNVFGFTPDVLKVLTWGLILLADLLMYKVLGKVTNNYLTTILFLTAFILLQSFLDGNMLWFDFATVLPLLAAFLCGLKWLEGKRLRNLFLTSFFLTIAILIKQTAAVYFLFFCVFYLLVRGRLREIRVIREIGVMAGGALMLVIPLVLYLAVTDSLTFFWNWTLRYPLTEWSKFPGYVNFSISPKYILVTLLLIAPLLGSLLNFSRLIKDRIFIWSLTFLIAALIAVFPRFSFFHLQPAVAFIVILLAKIYLSTFQKFKPFYLGFVVFLCTVIVGLLYKNEVGDGIRFNSESDQKLTQEIMNTTNVGERVYLLGLNSSQYAFAKRLPPKYWSDNFGWYLEIPGVQEWTIQGFKDNLPEKVFWRIPSRGNWYDLGAYQPQKITEFIRQNYHLTGKIETGVELWIKN